MALRDLHDEYAYLAQSLPTPTNTPYRTPPGSLSRPSSRYGSSSPGPSSSPPPLPPDQGWSEHHDSAKDESVSMLDPRRLTPTLHASLVSEILSLRREVDSRTTFIEQLERRFDTSRTDYENLDRNFLSTAKETRSLRRQLQLLEGGTASALGELGRERDEAVDGVADAKRRLEISQKKVRAAEDSTNRTQRLWDRDKQKWAEQRRNMERKVHVVEGRLKAILEEVAAQQAATRARDVEEHVDNASDGEEFRKEGVFYHGSDCASIRSPSRKSMRPMSAMSTMSNDSVRFPALRGPNGHTDPRHPGLSLADELNLDEEDEDRGLEEETQPSRGQEGVDISHTAVDPLGISNVAGDGYIDKGAEAHTESGHDRSATLERLGSAIGDLNEASLQRSVCYVDTGSQFSPLLSPEVAVVSPEPLDLKQLEERAFSPAEHEANQKRKPATAKRSSVNSQASLPFISISAPTMVSTSCQTLEEPPSPPKTPKSSSSSPPESPILAFYEPIMSSSGTQTDPPSIPEPTREPPPPPFTIPAIAIHPPTSAPPSPGLPVLPPRTKHAACQVSMDRSKKLRSVSVQTEEIRVDKRVIKLPAGLLPSSISSAASPSELATKPRTVPKPSSPSKRSSRRVLNTRKPIDPPSSPPRPISRAAFKRDGHGHGHGQISADTATAIKPRVRSSGSFAGVDILSSDEDYDSGEAELSDAVFRTALSAPRPRRRSNTPVSKPAGFTVDEKHRFTDDDLGPVHLHHSRTNDAGFPGGRGIFPRATWTTGSRRPAAKQQRSDKLPSGSFSKHSIERRPSLRSNGGSHRIRRTGSPGMGQASSGLDTITDPRPPFPVPTRSSSRRIPISASEGARSPSRHSVSTSVGNRRRESGQHQTNENLRKVRSATAMSRGARPIRRRSRSPPVLPSSHTLVSSLPYPLPRDEVTTPLSGRNHYRSAHAQQPSANTSYTGEASPKNSGPQKEIVDAITQAMVGEWMWKYIRRRKSFGISENSQSAAEFSKAGEDMSVNGIRHRRWVWLAPYERAVMWSNKQPTTGAALLGKSGRKLMIQSVLDVKDDTPPPKQSGGQVLFNRSILILTPARALKFTATSRDTHYVWLTALSFLSRPSIGDNELVALPPIPRQEHQVSDQSLAAGLRRNPIRDSIRVAKGKARARSTKVGPPLPSPRGGIAQDGSIRASDDKSSHKRLILTAADPPTIPRFSTHGRHRSNTGGRPPMGALRSFTHPPMPLSNHSLGTSYSSEIYGNGSSVAGSGFSSGPSSGPNSIDRRTSEVSSATGMTTINLAEAVGTVRMEAFVRGTSPSNTDGHSAYCGSPPLPVQDGKWGEQSWQVKTGYLGHHSEDPDDFFRADDPFRGF